MIKIFLHLLMLVSFLNANGSLSGKSVDKINNVGLADVNIIWKSQSEEFGSSSDQSGVFKIESIPRDSYELSISYIGFEKYKKKLEIKDEVINNDNNIVSQTDLEIFSSMIKSQVMENWKRPTNLSSNLKTEIQITLVPTGEILSSKIINSSGNRAFDDSALTAISRLKSFDGLNMQMNLFVQHFRKFILIFSPE